MNWTGLYIALIVLLPLVGGLIGLFIKNESRLALIGTLLNGIPLLLSLWLLLVLKDSVWVYQFDWMPQMKIGWSVDRLSNMLLVLVSLISTLVNYFSRSYMAGDTGFQRYFFKLGLFATSMLGLLVSDHLILVFIFWELVGFSSYLLIGFWYQEAEKARSARIAFIVNRFADVALLTGIILILLQTDFPFVSGLPELSTSLDNGYWIGLALLLGALGKSAQFPFFTWLPHAMAGPTPVSALIHAATMVAAGVYLLVRVHVIFPVPIMDLMALIGGVTALLGAIAALKQFDIKKVLAYSTISQLGYMVMAVGVDAYDMAIFHLWTHAFFKAGLFLSAGAIIHALHHSKDPQDMRTMGGLKAIMPFTFVAYTVCMLALVGLPLFSGFFSKDGILLSAMDWADRAGTASAYLIPTLGFISVLLTAFYMGRQYWMVFWGEFRGSHQILSHEPLNFKLPLGILALGSLWIFYSLNPLGHEFALVQYLFGSSMSDSDWRYIVIVISILLVAIGMGFSYMRFKPGSSGLISELIGDPERGISKLSFHAFYFDWLYLEVFRKGYEYMAIMISRFDRDFIDPMIDRIGVGVVVISKLTDLFDKLIIDGIVKGVAWLSALLGQAVKQFHAPRVQQQFVWVVLGLLFIILWINIV